MREYGGYRFRRTTLGLMGCLALLSGLGFAHVGYRLSGWWCGLWLAPLVIGWRRQSWLALLMIMVFGGTLGWWRGSLYLQRLATYRLLDYHNVSLQLTAADDAVYGKQTQLTFDATQVHAPHGQILPGKIMVSGFGPPAIYQGDVLLVSGKLYPGLGTYRGFMSYADLQIIGHRGVALAQQRRAFTAGMQSALPEPLASFAMGLLIGQRASLPASVKQDLLMVGLTHVIAVSGYNLTIMLEASKKVFQKHSKHLSYGLSLALIGLFLLVAGNSASIVRAAIVSVLSLTATYYGRTTRPLLLIALAAVLTGYADPSYVWSDTSWYLSFLAFYGVLVLAPAIDHRLKRRWQQSALFAVALESVCAESMTLPYVLHTFGQMSFIGLPANVLVVALVPLAMLLSVIAGLGGMLAVGFSGWLAWPARLLLTYMLDTAHLLAHLPHVFAQNLILSTQSTLLLYGMLAGVSWLLWQRSMKSAIITDKKTIDSS